MPQPLFPRLDFIGRLESFAEDWEALMALLAARANPNPNGAGTRPAAAAAAVLPAGVAKIPYHRNPSPGGLSALLMGALRNDSALLRAVCDFYIQDYLCFGFLLPRGCEPPPNNNLH